MNPVRHPSMRGRRLPVLALIGLAVGLAGCQGPFPQSTFEPTSAVGTSLDNLFRLIFGLAVLVFVLVEAALLYTIVRFRARPGAPDPKPVHGNTALEIGWTLAPAFIIALIAIPTLSTIWQNAGDPSPDALQVQVVGHQWWWEFQYPQLAIATANELHVPQGREVVLNMTSADVIHSFWAPRLTGKRDLMLGRTNRLRFTPDSVGMFAGQCAEYCGVSHANMRLVVFVDDSTSFDQWVAAQSTAPSVPDSLDALAQRGYEAFRAVRTPASNSCVACHAIQGVSFGVLGPNLSHIASRTTIAGGMLENTAEHLASWLRDPAAVKPGEGKLKGSGAAMGMPNVGLTEDEIAGLVAYLETLR